MLLASLVSRSAVLLALLGLSLPAAAQERRALPPPPDAALSLPPDPALEAGAADVRGGASLTRVGEWAYGPSYAIATFGQGVVSGHGRVLRIDGPPGTIPGRQDIVLPGLVRDVAVGSSLIYVATSSVLASGRGITVIEPSPAGSGVAGGIYGRSCVSVAAAGPRVYAVVYDPALASYVLLVLDATAPGLVPTVLGEVAIDGTGGGIAVLGTTVYVAAGAAGTAVIDAGDAAAPAVVQYLDSGTFARRVAVRTAGGAPRLAVASGQYAPVLRGSVSVFDLVVPAQPSLSYVTTFASPVEDVLWNPNTATASGFLDIYVAASTGGLYTLGDAGGITREAYTVPANVVPGVTRLARGPAGTGYVLVADYYYGTFAYDELLNGYTRLDEGENFALDAEADSQDRATVYVADGTAGIVRLRAEAGGRLVETGRAHDAAWNYTRALAQNATHLYAADGFSGVHAVDKATMTRTATITGTGAPNSDVVAVSADGQTLFVRDRLTVTDAYSLADPARPVLLWERADLDPGTFASAGGVLYVGERLGSNVRALSLADPTNPAQTATRSVDGTNVGVVLSGARLYARGGTSRVSVFDTSAPAAPILLGTVPTSGSRIDARGTALYAGGTNGLAAYDATTPGSPVLLATYNDGRVGSISDVAATDTDVFLAEGSSGVERIAAQIATAAEGAPEADLALSVAPNPAAGRVAVLFTLAEAGAVEADVLDVLGRRVAMLTSGPAAAGAQRLAWDVTGADGRRVAAGLYLVRVRTAAGIQTQRITVVR